MSSRLILSPFSVFFRQLKRYGFEISVFCSYVETGTLLYPFGWGDAAVAVEVGREVAMAEEYCLGEATMERGEEASEGVALRFGARVGSSALFVEPSFVADAYGVAVVASAVCSRLPQRSSYVLQSVARDIIMVAYVF